MPEKLAKVLSLILVLLLLFSVAAGCGKQSTDQTSEDGKADGTVQETEGETGDAENNGEEPNEPAYDFGGRSIRYSAWWDLAPVAGSSEGADKMIERMAEMEEKYNFKMEYINIPYEQTLETFSASVLAGDPYSDIAIVENTWFFPGLVLSGMIMPVDALGVFDFEEEKWNQTSIKACTWEGKVYGFNTGRQFPRGVMFWNKSMFEREGLPNLYELQRNKEWTWDKMLEIAKKATKDLDGDGVIDQYGLGGIDIAWQFVYSNTGETIKYVDGKPVFALTDPPALEALQFYQDLIHVHKVFDYPPDGSPWDYATQRFNDGITAMYGYQWWVAGNVFQANMQDDYGVVCFPMGPRATEYVSEMTAENFTVFPIGVKDPEQVAIVFDEMTDPFPDEDPDAWKEGYEASARDYETIETIQMIQDKNLSIMNPLRGITELQNMSYSFMYEINTANASAKVAIEKIAQQAQAVIDDAFRINEN